MGESLIGERLLLIMPHFYGYTQDVKQEFINNGYSVDVYYEEPPRLLFLVLRNVDRFLRKPFLLPLCANLLIWKIKRKNVMYDKLIVIRGNIFSKENIVKLKNTVLKKGCECVYYSWDSFHNMNHNGTIGELFDRRYSFDSQDVKKNTGWELLPLFFTKQFDTLSVTSQNGEAIYDLCCIASFNRYRYELLKNIVKCNPSLNVKVILYIDKKLFQYKKKADSFFRSIDEEWISFDPLNFRDVIDYYNKSVSVLDITYESQTGLSMRTIESVGMRKKLVTNNKYVLEYPLYKENNIFVIDDTVVISESWLKEPYTLDENIRNQYAINSWAKTLLGRDVLKDNQ